MANHSSRMSQTCLYVLLGLLALSSPVAEAARGLRQSSVASSDSCDSYRILFTIDLMPASGGLADFFAQLLKDASSVRYPDASPLNVTIEWDAEKPSEKEFGDFQNNCTWFEANSYQQIRQVDPLLCV
eukprot:scaffold570834_cov34-Prasinocladus_malaysianus.AAC.1